MADDNRNETKKMADVPFDLLSREELIAEIERKVLLLPLEKKKLVLKEIDAILNGR